MKRGSKRVREPEIKSEPAQPVLDRILEVQRSLSVFNSLEEADVTDARADAQLTPEERIQIIILLRDRLHLDAYQQRLARVYRVVELEGS